jgi:hypothetical protein
MLDLNMTHVLFTTLAALASFKSLVMAICVVEVSPLFKLLNGEQ